MVMTAVDFGSDPKESSNIQTTRRENQSDGDTQSLEERNERELLEHPDEVTQEAQVGVQKAEATALVWSKTALYATYAW